ncbi:MAG: flagellar export protein FliJ [Lachnospiraceae bacterium]
MKKFTYSMQSILNLQYELEKQQKALFSEANEVLSREEAVLKDMIMQKDSYQQQLKQLMCGEIDVNKIQTLKHQIDVMKSRIRTQMMAVHMAEKNVEAARIRLTEAMVNRKTQERMREIAFEEYQREVAQEEVKEIDQLVSYTHSH